MKLPGAAYATVFLWLVQGQSFEASQSISTNGATSWEHFEIEGSHFLAVANNNNGGSLNIDSKIYKWTGAAFAEFQNIATSGAEHWEHFELAGSHFLAVANHFDGASRNIDSKIYKWSGGGHVCGVPEHQH